MGAAGSTDASGSTGPTVPSQQPGSIQVVVPGNMSPGATAPMLESTTGPSPHVGGGRRGRKGRKSHRKSHKTSRKSHRKGRKSHRKSRRQH
jgi:hypothetical protein